MRRILVFLFAACFAAPNIHGSCGAASCPIELHALGPNDNALSVDLSFQYIDQRHLTRGSSFSGEETHEELRTINRLTSLQVNAPISSRLQLSATVPFVGRSHEHVDLGSFERERWDFHQLGDITVQMRGRLLRFNTLASQSLWLTAALKLPTGVRHERAVGGGEDAEVMIVPGSGSVDALIGISFRGGIVRHTALEGPFGSATAVPYFVSATWRRNGHGTDQYRMGNELQLNAGTEFPVGRHLDLLAQVNARMRGKDDPGETGENPDLTGGRYLYFSPGMRVDIGRNSSVYGYAQFPIEQHVNGVQLTSSVNYVVGVRQRF